MGCWSSPVAPSLTSHRFYPSLIHLSPLFTHFFLNFFYFYTSVLRFIEAAKQERIQFAHNIMFSSFSLLSLFSSHYIIYQICHSLSLSLFLFLSPSLCSFHPYTPNLGCINMTTHECITHYSMYWSMLFINKRHT